jgi:hypothetical protein
MQTKKQILRKMTAPVLFGTMLLLFTACPRNSKTTYVDLGRIPEQYLATVPYQNGDVFRMQHESDRLIIDFAVSRHRHKETGFDYILLEKYKPAPNYIYEYESDITKCTPNYPIFNVEINFSNRYMAFEEEQDYAKNATLFAVGSAMFPFIGEDHSDYEMLDSLKVNDRYYHDVFKLKSELVDYYEEEGSIHAETYYYNYEKGLLGVIMSNGEKYWLYED